MTARRRPHDGDRTGLGVVGTAPSALVSTGFSLYTSPSGSNTRPYGAFPGVAILIFWLYLTGVAILAGGEVDAAFERQTPARRDETPEAGGPVAL